MSDKIPVQVMTALGAQHNELSAMIKSASNAAAPNIVTAVNGMRAAGIVIKQMVGRENVTENCLRELLRKNPGLLIETDVGWLMQQVRIANKLQQWELALFCDAYGFCQITMQFAGLLAKDAERQSPQLSHEVTAAPTSIIWKQLADWRLKFSDLIANSNARWDDDTRAYVKQNIEKTRAFLAELETKL